MASSGIFSDRLALPVPGDAQEEPSDDATQARSITDADAENWGDIIQTLILSDLDDRLAGIGTLASRPAAGTDSARWWLVTNGGASGDQPYLSFNDDTEWHLVNRLPERRAVVAADSPYNASAGESLWVDASGGAVTVNLPAPSDRLTVRVVVVDATNDVTLSRNGTETIDGTASDLTLTSEVVRELESDGTNWRSTTQSHSRYTDEEAQDAVGTILGEGLAYDDATPEIAWEEPVAFDPGMTEWEAGLSDEEIWRVVLQAGETLVVDRIEFQQKGGGSSTSVDIDVHDATAAATIGSADLGSVTKDAGSSGSGNTVVVRVTNGLTTAVNAAPRVVGRIQGA